MLSSRRRQPAQPLEQALTDTSRWKDASVDALSAPAVPTADLASAASALTAGEVAQQLLASEFALQAVTASPGAPSSTTFVLPFNGGAQRMFVRCSGVGRGGGGGASSAGDGVLLVAVPALVDAVVRDLVFVPRSTGGRVLTCACVTAGRKQTRAVVEGLPAPTEATGAGTGAGAGASAAGKDEDWWPVAALSVVVPPLPVAPPVIASSRYKRFLNRFLLREPWWEPMEKNAVLVSYVRSLWWLVVVGGGDCLRYGRAVVSLCTGLFLSFLRVCVLSTAGFGADASKRCRSGTKSGSSTEPLLRGCTSRCPTGSACAKRTTSPPRSAAS